MPPRFGDDPLPESTYVADAVEFGAWIRAFRRQQGLRIDDAAALCGVSVELLHSLETGSRAVGLPKALRVARRLGLAFVAMPLEQVPDASRVTGLPE
jgi:transcriptional regulator with XRE-family HTH domain